MGRYFGALLLLLAAATARADATLTPLLTAVYPALGDGAPVIPAEHLPPDRPLVLVLWNTDCEDCLANVEQLAALRRRQPQLPLLGAVEAVEPWDALGFALDRDLGFPQFHDPTLAFAAALDAEGASFAFALVNRAGDVLARHVGAVPDAAAALEDALARTPATAPPAIDFPRVSTSGRVRLLWLGVGVADHLDAGPCDTAPGLCACALGGAYGEALYPVVDLVYRLRVDMTVLLSPRLRAGGRLRLSNEPAAVLAQGPQYLANARGSAFAEFVAPRASARLGFFETVFTPLTLQRWDAADNPPVAGSGGAGGCGSCGTSTHGLALESLDDLAPPLTFEGARLAAAPRPWLRAEAFYAVPRRAHAFDANADPVFAYRQDLLAGRMELRRTLGGATPASLVLAWVAANENPESADWPLYAGDPASFVQRGEVTSLALTAPLPATLTLDAEAARSRQRVDRVDASGQAVSDWAARVALRATPAEGLVLAAGWLHLGRDYGAEYRALSYLPDTEGWRASASYRRPRWGLALFHKQLQRVEAFRDGGSDLARSRLTSALVSLAPCAGTHLDLSATLGEDRLEGESADCSCRRDCQKLTLGAVLKQTLAPRVSASLEYVAIALDSDLAGGTARADIGRLLVTADF
ncbi:hypothetical protein KDL67_05095 [bacterium]|nr:hypothetical protein [bacterium]